MMKLQKIMTDFTHITLSMHFAIQYRETSDGLLLALPLLCLSLSHLQLLMGRWSGW